MSPPPPRLNRRRALAAGAASLGALALAACGESPAESAVGSLPANLQAELDRNLQRARAEARNVTAAAPRPAVNLPTPGARHEVTVAMYPSNRIGGSLFGQFVNGLAAARERAEDRYAYVEASLDYGRNASTFSLSTSLDALLNQKPDLVIFFRADQADLLANDRLAPLDDFLFRIPTSTPPTIGRGCWKPGNTKARNSPFRWRSRRTCCCSIASGRSSNRSDPPPPTR